MNKEILLIVSRRKNQCILLQLLNETNNKYNYYFIVKFISMHSVSIDNTPIDLKKFFGYKR